MQRQAIKRDHADEVRDAAQYDQGGSDREYDYALRDGHHYGQAGDGRQGDEAEYDPRAYAPNPDEPYGYDDDGNPLFYEPAQQGLKSGRGAIVMVGAVLAVALLGGAGAVAYKMVGPGMLGGEPPLIKAETDPIKTVPEKPSETATPSKAIYDRVEQPATSKSKVVSREEEPVELPSAPVSEPRADGSRIILPGGPASAETTAPGTLGNEPRRVKTMTIRPDTQLAAANQPNGAPAEAGQARDPIAEAARTGGAPRSEFEDGIMSDERPAAAQRQGQPRNGAQATPAPERPQAQPQQQAVRPAPAPAPAARPAAPAPAPAPAQSRSDPQQVAALAPRAPAPAAAETPRAAAGGFVVQVSSQRSEQEARSAYAALQRRFPQVLGSYQASIQTATVGERGTYYRVRVGPFANGSDASTVCNNLRSAGGDCVVSRN